MASLSTIARPYAKAVFAHAKASGTVDHWGAVLALLQQVVDSNEVSALLKDPAVLPEQWQSLLMSMCEGLLPQHVQKISDQLVNFIALIIEMKRLVVFSELTHLFHALSLKDQGVVEVGLWSVYPVDSATQSAFQAMLEKRFNASVRLSCDIDASLIGGVLLRSGDWVMDGSIKRKLMRLKTCIMHQACVEDN